MAIGPGAVPPRAAWLGVVEFPSSRRARAPSHSTPTTYSKETSHAPLHLTMRERAHGHGRRVHAHHNRELGNRRTPARSRHRRQQPGVDRRDDAVGITDQSHHPVERCRRRQPPAERESAAVDPERRRRPRTPRRVDLCRRLGSLRRAGQRRSGQFSDEHRLERRVVDQRQRHRSAGRPVGHAARPPGHCGRGSRSRRRRRRGIDRHHHR